MSPKRGGWLRVWLAIALLLLPLGASAQDVLILIQHDQAGPNLPAADFFHGEWVRWPSDSSGRNNRILSVACGVDLEADGADSNFLATDYGGWRPQNGRSLARRGFFESRRARIGDVSVVALTHGGAVSPSILLLALNDPELPVKSQPFEAVLPSSGLVVAEAKGWDEAIALTGRATGRSLVVEYPPGGFDGWSRFWTKGKGWPQGVPIEHDLRIPGLVRGSRVLTLLQSPASFAWRPNDAGRWGGPNRWLEHGYDVAPGVLLGWFTLAAFVLAWAIAQVMNEDRGPFVSEMLVLVALSPAALVVSGAGAAGGGLEAWPIVLPLSLIGLYGASWGLTLILRRNVPEAHPLWAPCGIGLLCLVLGDPLWSDFSGRFGPVDLDVPGLALGAFLAYLTGVAAFTRGRWLGRATVAALLLWGVTGGPWWVGGHSALLIVPALALVAAEGLFRPFFVLALALLPTGLLRLVHEGAVWSPGGLLAHANDVGALNLWQSFVLLFSPAWLGTTGVLALGLLVGNRFLAYRLGRLLRHDPRLRAFPWAAAGVFALGTTEPLALPAVPVVAFGTLVALAYDGLRANA